MDIIKIGDKLKDTLSNELKQVKTKTLEKSLPIWIDYSLETQNIPLEGRLDNNFFSSSYYESLRYIKQLEEADVIEIKHLSDLIIDKFTGKGPDDDGDVPLIDGKKIRPNTVDPVFQKFGIIEDNEQKFIVNSGDILITKDGMPGAFAMITDSYLKTMLDLNGFDKVAISTHVYKLLLKKEYSAFASFIISFMNSRIGQGLVRHFISGSVIPTIGGDDLENIIIPLPTSKVKNSFDDVDNQISNLQRGTNELAYSVSYSNNIVNSLFNGICENPELQLTCNWMPGGKRDPHAYYKR